MSQGGNDEASLDGSLGGFFEQDQQWNLPMGRITPVFKSATYWERVYTEELPLRARFEWYGGFEAVQEPILRLVPLSAHVLELGCGNSALAEQLLSRGYRNLTCMDFSHVVVEAMQKRLAPVPVLQMDARDMSRFPAATFDVVLDKATADALFLDGGDAQRPDFALMVREVARVLRAGGCWLTITRKTPADWYLPFVPAEHQLLHDCTGAPFHCYLLRLPGSQERS
jgi:SAM-dependent methyltransferase